MNTKYEKLQNQLPLLIISVLVSLSFCILIYVYYLQSFGLSLYRLAAALAFFLSFSFLVFISIQYVLRSIFDNDIKQFLGAVGFWAIISALFAPHIFPYPYYPISPLFRKTSDLEIRISFPEGKRGEMQLKGVWLTFDDKKFSYLDFETSGEWVMRSGRYFIDSDLQGRLHWKGKVGEKAKLTLFPMDEVANVTILWDGVESLAILDDKPVSFVKKSATPAWFYIFIVLAQFTAFCYLIFLFFTKFQTIRLPNQRRTITHIILLCLSFLLVYAHFQSNDIRERFDLQIGYHQGVLTGSAPSPWQYRIFSEWLVAGLTSVLSPLGYEAAFYYASLLIRIVQNLLIYSMSYCYFRKLNFTDSVSLVGTIFLSGSLLNSYYNTGFSLNTYFDLVFYLGGVLFVLNQSFAWLPLLMIFAALNRETSGMIPLLALSSLHDIQKRRPAILFAGLAIFVWAGIFVALRLSYPPREMFVPYGNQPGFQLFEFNLFPPPYLSLLRFFSIVPLLGLIVWRRWLPRIKRYFIIMVPVWGVVHLTASVIAETRLFLVPQLIVFIPAFLLFVDGLAKKLSPSFSVNI